MNFSKLFIQRPVATFLLMIALLVSGIMSYRELPVSALPQVDYPTIQVITQYPGASPELMTSLVTSPLERELGQMPGLLEMHSSSALSHSVITLQFSLDLPIAVAEQQVQAAINAASNLLPSDLPSPPIYHKVNPADAPVMSLAIVSHQLPLYEVRDLIETRIAQRLAQLQGVGLLSIVGGQKPAIRIQVNPQKLANHGLSLSDIRTIITSNNTHSPTGNVDGIKRSTTIYVDGQLRQVKDYETLVLKQTAETVLRLADVAQIVYDAEDVRQAAWYGDQAALLLNIQRQPSANVIELAEKIKTLLPELQQQLPSTVDLQIALDRTISIQQSVKHVKQEMLLAMGLVVLVTFVFLRSMMSTLIPSVVVPLSIIGTFILMHFLGYSLNNLSLMALTIATGFVVDDAIVMIENIARYIEEGESPIMAALKGAKEIGFTLISLTFSLVAVLIPLLFMADVVGRLFQEFAMTLAIAILFSLLISLTLTPMLCAYGLKPPQQENRLQVFLREGLDEVVHVYAKALAWVLKHEKLTLWVAVLSLGVTVALYIFIPKSFFPVQDTGMLQIVTQGPQSASFKEIAMRQQAMVKIIEQDPDVYRISSFIGVDHQNPSLNVGRVLVQLHHEKPRETIQEIMNRLHHALERQTQMQVFIQAVQDLTIDTQIARTQYQLNVEAMNEDLLKKWVPKLLDTLKTLPSVWGVSDSLQTQGLQVEIDVDRQKAAHLGVSMASVNEALYNAFGQRFISTIFTQSTQYRVILELAPQYRQSVNDLQDIYVKGREGLVRLETIATLLPTQSFLEKQRTNQYPSALISFNVNEGYALSDVLKEIENIAIDAGVSLKAKGAIQAFERTLENTLWLFVAAVFTMYIILGVLYESYIHPITILSTLPSATIGALLALWMSAKPLDMIGVIGIILLIGIVKKNAIMMVDFALSAEREQGLDVRQAITQAALRRFRPILMTSLAALFGAIPLMFSTGLGAELRSPLGLVLVGGLVCSQLLTIFTTPVIYLFFHRFQHHESV